MNLVKEFTNRTAHYNYFIGDKYEAGIKLTGTEIKSIRDADCNLTDSYVTIRNGKVYIVNMYIGKYFNGNLNNHEERRERELLLHKRQIRKLANEIKLKGNTIVATRAYFVKALFKIEIAVAKGKNLHDKRETVKKRDIERSLKNY